MLKEVKRLQYLYLKNISTWNCYTIENYKYMKNKYTNHNYNSLLSKFACHVA